MNSNLDDQDNNIDLDNMDNNINLDNTSNEVPDSNKFDAVLHRMLYDYLPNGFAQLKRELDKRDTHTTIQLNKPSLWFTPKLNQLKKSSSVVPTENETLPDTGC